MAERWVSRVALVTGASTGIGAAITRTFVEQGMKVVGCVKGDEFQQLQVYADELNSQNSAGLLHPVKCDVSKENDILSMFAEIKDKFGGVDVCVNNAGLSIDSPLLTGKTEHWRYMFDVNVMGVAICTREAVRQMIERGVDDGHVFHINSIAGHHVGVGSTMGFYSGTKHMITAMTEGLRQELRLKDSHIRITSLSPGRVETQFYVRMFDEETKQKKARAFKNLQPDDIASSVLHALHAPGHCLVHDIRILANEQA